MIADAVYDLTSHSIPSHNTTAWDDDQSFTTIEIADLLDTYGNYNGGGFDLYEHDTAQPIYESPHIIGQSFTADDNASVKEISFLFQRLSLNSKIDFRVYSYSDNDGANARRFDVFDPSKATQVWKSDTIIVDNDSQTVTGSPNAGEMYTKLVRNDGGTLFEINAGTAYVVTVHTESSGDDRVAVWNFSKNSSYDEGRYGQVNNVGNSSIDRDFAFGMTYAIPELNMTTLMTCLLSISFVVLRRRPFVR